MKRILFIIFKRLFLVPIWFFQFLWCKNHPNKYSLQEKYDLLRKVERKVAKAGRINVIPKGLENIPKEDGFIFYGNHQGMYDPLAIMEVYERPFSFVAKKELKDVPMLKQVFEIMNAKLIDREDIKQSLSVIIDVYKEVKGGKNYLIFPEGTRCKNGTDLLAFKGGSFKCAIKAKCPIVPVAIWNSRSVFETNSIKKVDVYVSFLKPLTYEEYKDINSTEIANMVRSLIQEEVLIQEKMEKELSV